MKKIHDGAWMLAATLLILALAAVPAQASGEKKQEEPRAVFVNLDANHDGKVTQAEFITVYKDKVKAEKYFKELDKDGNGYLVKEEYTVAVQKLKTPKKSRSKMKVSRKPGFIQADKNHDGRVNEEEFIGYYGNKVKARKKFKAYDKNGDGYLVTEEWVTTKEKLPAKGVKK